MSPILVFAISWVVVFGILAGAFTLVQRALRERRRQAFERLMRVRAVVYAQMNALLGEFQRLGRMSSEERAAAVSPDPFSSPTGQLLADVAERLAIVEHEIVPAQAPRDLRELVTQLDKVISVSLAGIRESFEATTAERFIEVLPKASPSAHIRSLRQLDAKLAPLAENEGLTEEDSFYKDARLYV